MILIARELIANDRAPLGARIQGVEFYRNLDTRSVYF